jgi:ketosteroid isomerase-like protein
MTAEERVLAADDARLAALIAADADALDRLCADDLVFVHANGRQDDKAAFLEQTRSGHLRYRSIVRNITSVTVSGNIAIVYASVDVEVTTNGERRASPVRYMSVWTNGGGEWKMLAIDNVRPPAVPQ